MRVPLQEGAQVFIDANIFLNVIFESPEFSGPSARFLLKRT
jgi:predicted nucleic acid-binding protein